MLTTLSMVQYGKCLENLMIDLMPANAKLRDRALRITLLLVDSDKCNEDMAQRILEKNSYDIKKTVFELRTEISNSETVI
jgi:N-acetylmuramic acid 6-phosphate (MurNAc-6-P) etherase